MLNIDKQTKILELLDAIKLLVLIVEGPVQFY